MVQVLLPQLSALASRMAYPDRAYDISPNVFDQGSRSAQAPTALRAVSAH